jgi:hypothetical protein
MSELAAGFQFSADANRHNPRTIKTRMIFTRALLAILEMEGGR